MCRNDLKIFTVVVGVFGIHPATVCHLLKSDK
jgi:hypothetical protein